MKPSLLHLLLISMLAFSCGQVNNGGSTDELTETPAKSIEHNKKFATQYHDLNPDNIDLLFTEDFTGHGENGHTWDRESHRNYLSNGRYKVDNITLQVAEGDWVCTMFTRTMLYQGDTITLPVMHFKRFEEGMIAEVWEYYDYKEESDE